MNIRLDYRISIKCESTKKPPGTEEIRRGYDGGFMEMIDHGYREFFHRDKIVLDETE